MIIEKGDHSSAKKLATQSEADALETLYERGGAVLSEDYAIGTFAGSTVGGGSTVNWFALVFPLIARSASFKLPYHVREEWATKHGLK